MVNLIVIGGEGDEADEYGGQVGGEDGAEEASAEGDLDADRSRVGRDQVLQRT